MLWNFLVASNNSMDALWTIEKLCWTKWRINSKILDAIPKFLIAQLIKKYNKCIGIGYITWASLLNAMQYFSMPFK